VAFVPRPEYVADVKKLLRPPLNIMPDVDALRLRIHNEADPLGALIAIANGEPLLFRDVDAEGTATIRQEHVSVSARLQVLRDLKDVLVPKVSRNDPTLSDQRQSREWEALVEKRAGGK
jgi:hypothetical protein